MKTILLVEDCPLFRAAVAELLASEFQVEAVGTLGEAKAVVKKIPVDLVVLDLNLPDGSGLEFCSMLAADEAMSHISVLILSGNSEPSLKAVSLDLGADDFVEKPFSKMELVSRIKARLRRSEQRQAPSAVPVGSFVVDYTLLKVYLLKDGAKVDTGLTPLEFRIFTRLVSSPGRIFSRDQLIEMVAGPDYHVSDRSIDTHVCALRRKLGDKAKCVRTVRGAGYIFETKSA